MKSNAAKCLRRRLGSVLLALSLLMATILGPAVPVKAATRFWTKTGTTCYNGNGEKIPGAITRGIDVSAWQGTINWPKVKEAALDFVFIRTGHGSHVPDTQFQNNMKGAINAGIPVGVYFYSEATTTSQSVSDAKWVIDQIQGYKISYPVVVDMESSKQAGLSNTQRSNIAKSFMDEIKKAGYYPMLYCNTYWYRNNLNASILSGYDKWLANYGDGLKAPTGVASSVYTIWQATDGNTANGLKSTRGLIPGIPTVNSVDVDFGYKDYTKIITPRTKANDSYLKGEGWIKDSTGYRYYLANGTYVKSRSYVINGKTYYFKDNGYMATNWYQHTNGKWYYFGSNGVRRTGLHNIGGKRYYFNKNGVMQTGFVTSNGTTYMFADSGERLSGWQKNNGNWYYLSGSGAVKKGWQIINGSRYYFSPKTGIMVTGLHRLGGQKYYFDSNGKVKTGWFSYTNGKWYYANGNGVILSNKWIKVQGLWYYLNPTGSMRTGWLTYEGDRYYLTQNGSMKVGWLKYNGKYYYFDKDGKMLKNTTRRINGKDYTFNASGVRVG